MRAHENMRLFSGYCAVQQETCITCITGNACRSAHVAAGVRNGASEKAVAVAARKAASSSS